MKRLILFFITLLIYSNLFSQDGFVPGGKAFATIFANFHRGIIGEGNNEMAFELERGYIGYEYNFSPEFYAKINLDIGSPNDLSEYSKLRRYAYFKNAYLRYSKNKLEIEFGLIGLRQFKLQEKVWERRYLMKSFADEYKLGSSADLGVNFHYRFNDFIDADLTIMNGEGYNNIQTDDIFKYGLGSTIKFPKNFTSRVYYDFSVDAITESSLLFFSSYDFRGKWNMAGEFIYRWNDSWDEGHDLFGVSVYGKYNFWDKYQLFARFDKIESNILKGETNPWNLADDGTALVAGIQYNPVKNIKMAINYKDWYPWASNSDAEGFIYVNLEVKM